MTREDLGRSALGVGMTAAAGYVDAVGFLRLTHLFVSFMSGDSTELAVDLVKGRWREAGSAGGIVVLFVIGVAFGRRVATAAGPWGRPAVLSVIVGLLLTAMAAGPWSVGVAIAALTLAMGCQNAVAIRIGPLKFGHTYVTGALVSLGEKLAVSLSGEPWAWTPYALLWLGLSAGAGAGAFAYGRLGLDALIVPATGLALIGALAGGLVRRAESRGPSP